jgi:hypothetical protein
MIFFMGVRAARKTGEPITPHSESSMPRTQNPKRHAFGELIKKTATQSYGKRERIDLSSVFFAKDDCCAI